METTFRRRGATTARPPREPRDASLGRGPSGAYKNAATSVRPIQLIRRASTMKQRNSHYRDLLVATAILSQLAAVPLADAAFKIPGIPMAGGGQSAVPGGGRGAAGVGHRPQGGNGGGEYMGPVFIIRELDKDAELYDAFITTGGIQEARPPAPGKGHAAGQQLKSGGRPAAADEDSEYVGVMVTPETVRQIRFAKGVVVNASLSMLLNAASSRMPWLLVLRRSSHVELSAGGAEKGGPSQSTPAPQAAADQLGGISPNLMQLPQRRRYYGGSDTRQRRSVDFRFGRPLPPTAAAAADPGSVTRSVPLMLERELLTTMCFNFAREYYQTSTTSTTSTTSAPPTYWDDEDPQLNVRLNADAYAAAAARYDMAASSPEPEPPQQPADVPMAVPKRVS